MRIPRESKKPRNRHLPPPGKSERFWARKAGEEYATKPVTGGSLAALDARLATIEAELAAKWPNDRTETPPTSGVRKPETL